MRKFILLRHASSKYKLDVLMEGTAIISTPDREAIFSSIIKLHVCELINFLDVLGKVLNHSAKV